MEPDDVVPLVAVPEGVVELMLPDADGAVLDPGELALPDPGEVTGLLDGELVLRPVPLPLVVPVLPLLMEPDAPPLPTEPDAPPLPIDPDAPGPDVVGDAEGD